MSWMGSIENGTRVETPHGLGVIVGDWEVFDARSRTWWTGAHIVLHDDGLRKTYMNRDLRVVQTETAA